MYTDSGPWTVVRVRGGGTVTPVVVSLQSVATELAEGAAKMAGLALLAAGLAAVVAMVHWWYVRERVPGGLPVLVGLSGVAVAIGTTGALRQVIGSPDGDTLDDDDGASTGSGATADGDAADDEEEGAPGERGDGDRDGGDDASGERS
jgi:hypothetical protein